MRTRSIKPSFWKNEDLAELEPITLLLFQGLWCLADREGRLEDRPKRIAAEVFPYRQIDCDAELEKLNLAKFIHRYFVKGEKFIQIISAHVHLTPFSKEPQSVIPPCPTLALPSAYVEPTYIISNKVKGKSKKVKGSDFFDLHLPPDLDSENFRDAWLDFCVMREEIKKPLTAVATKRLLKKLERFGLADAVTALNNSIEGSWQGVYRPDQQKRQTSFDQNTKAIEEGLR